MRSLLSRFLSSKPGQIYQHRRLFNNETSISRILTGAFPRLFPPPPPPKDESSGMDISKDRFGHEVVRLLHDIADSHFIAFDFEFSGSADRFPDRVGKPTVQERYEESRQSIQEYQPLQIGLTIVKLDQPNGRYVLEPYNFDLSPIPLLREGQFKRKWSMNSGAVSFLQRNGFDFGKQMLHGVPYLSLQEEASARSTMAGDAKRNDVQIKSEDQVLAAHTRDTIAAWQSQPVHEQDDYLNIPHGDPEGIPSTLNSFQRRLVHQIVQNEFPALKSQGMGHFIQVTNPSAEQQASQSQLEEEHRERVLSRAIGFRWIIDGIIGRDLTKLPEDYTVPALSDAQATADDNTSHASILQDLNIKLQARRKVLVGHNCMQDIMYLYRIAVGDLPPSLDEFRDQVHDLFPAIIDTKFVSHSFSVKYGRLSLGEVERDLATDPDLPSIHLPGHFSRYSETAFLHEAGYDSYITAKVAIQMATKLHMKGGAKKKDHDSKQQGVDQIAAAGDTTVTESKDNEPPKTLVGTIKSFFTTQPQSGPEPSIETDADETGSSPRRTYGFIPSPRKTSITATPSPVIAVKQITSDTPDKRKINPINWQDESAVAAVRSAFASTSIYDALGSENSSMPGEMNSEKDQAEKEQSEQTMQAKMDRMVKDGKMMPRWLEEAAFWEKHGNNLQVNGTREGVLKLVD